MSEYTNNNFENRDQMYQYHTRDNGFQPAPDTPAPRKRRSGGRAARTLKKAGAITLSAVLFGAVAAGTFQAVNYMTGYSASAAVPAAESGQTASAPEQQSVLQTTAISSSGATISGSLDVSDIAESVMPSIVAITNRSVQEVQNFFSMFGYGGQTQLRETESAGSGFIIGKNAEELLLVTNYHVVEDADTLSACFIDNQAYEANVKGTDPDNDLAVLAIPLESISDETMSQIKVASIGDSDSLKVGEQVVAIGNALGYGQSVTTGIVSATNRTISTGSSTANTSADDESVPTYIQTDAAINPGNSGGALCNAQGEVIGINTIKISMTGYEGMGFAIPSNDVLNICKKLMEDGKIARPALGVGILSDVTPQIAYYNNLSVDYGVLVAPSAGGAAEKAGLKTYDIIVAIDDEEIDTYSELQDTIFEHEIGDTVKVTVIRGGDKLDYQVTLGELED